VKPGDTVLIHDGVYREVVWIETSGTPTALITFQAAPGEHPVLEEAESGFVWQVYSGTIYVTTVPSGTEDTGYLALPNEVGH